MALHCKKSMRECAIIIEMCAQLVESLPKYATQGMIVGGAAFCGALIGGRFGALVGAIGSVLASQLLESMSIPETIRTMASDLKKELYQLITSVLEKIEIVDVITLLNLVLNDSSLTDKVLIALNVFLKEKFHRQL